MRSTNSICINTRLIFTAILALASIAEAVQPLGAFQSGTLTFFGGAPDGMNPSNPSFGTKEGSCGYGLIPKDQFPYFSTAAFSPQNSFYKSLPVQACGTCWQLQCADTSGACKTDSSGKPLSVIVQITDSCPECDADHLDVQALTFAKIANPSIGHINIQYRRVECSIPEDMKVSVMDFAGSGGWIRLSVDDTGGRGAVKSVMVKGSSSDSWQPMKNSWGAAWEMPNAPQPPLDFKFVCDDDEEVEAMQVIKQNGGISGGISSPVKFSTGQQFAITDPAAQMVKSFEGSDDPMVVTSNTPGNSGGSGSSSSSGGSSLSSSPSSGSSPQSSPQSPSPSPKNSPSPSSSPSPSPSPSPQSPSPSPSPQSPSPSPNNNNKNNGRKLLLS